MNNNTKATDNDLVEAWERTRNYAEVGRELGISRQTAMNRILRLRAVGVELSPAQPAGYALTPERAREIAKARRQKDADPRAN